MSAGEGELIDLVINDGDSDLGKDAAPEKSINNLIISNYDSDPESSEINHYGANLEAKFWESNFAKCNNSGYECCGRKEGKNNRKEYHSTSRARKVRSEIVASYCNILKVSQVLAFSTLGRCSFPFYRRMEGAPRLTYGTTRVHSL